MCDRRGGRDACSTNRCRRVALADRLAGFRSLRGGRAGGFLAKGGRRNERMREAKRRRGKREGGGRIEGAEGEGERWGRALMSFRGLDGGLEDRLFRRGGCITRPASAPPPPAFRALRSVRRQTALNHVGGLKTESEKKLDFLQGGEKKAAYQSSWFLAGG